MCDVRHGFILMRCYSYHHTNKEAENMKFNETPEQEALLNKMLSSNWPTNGDKWRSNHVTVTREQFEARDGWIVWRGGEQPVGGGVMVETKWADGDTITTEARDLAWFNDDLSPNIIAYRLHKPEQAIGSTGFGGFASAKDAGEALKSLGKAMNQGGKTAHPHAELMAQYAGDAKTNAEPWELWEIGDANGDWWRATEGFGFVSRLKYRRKTKTKLIHGVEVPDISFAPDTGDFYYHPTISNRNYYASTQATRSKFDELAHSHMMCYPHTEEGKQAAILHAKAMLGIADV